MRLYSLAVLAVLGGPSIAPAQSSPGRAVLEKMNAGYAGRWYKTLTFVQKTTLYRPGAAQRVQTWWESLRYTPERGVQLRIDNGDLSAGNGSLATVDSMWMIRNGSLAQVRGNGNEFLPWIEGVYVQPVDQTERQVRGMGVDMNKTSRRSWRGRPTTVLGASSADDTTHSQAWIDDERQVIVRMILKPDSTAPLLDVLLEGYERLGGGWIGTKVDIHVDGVLRQREEYSDWKADVPLSPDLFDPAKWTTAPHWARRP